MNSFDLTLSLLRAALWGGPVEPLQLGREEWDDVYRTACAQGVHTLVFDAFRPGCVPPQPLLARWLADVEKAETAFERISRVQDELCRLWEKRGIRYSVMKGLKVAGMYPHPSHRLSGDIDFHFPDGNSWNQAEKLARTIAAVSSDSDGDIHYLWRNVVIEHHRRWSHVSGRWDEGEEDMLVMLSSHILRHAMIGGAGLRQLADYAVVLRSLHGSFDRQEYADRMRRLSLSRWEGLLAAVMKGCFGVSEEELLFSPDPRHLDAFMSLVGKDGNLGHENSHILSGGLRRFLLFARLCPGEYAARWKNLIVGRIRRIFTNRRK